MSRCHDEQEKKVISRNLVDILRSLPDTELELLARRVQAKIDRSKRVDASVQVARVLVGLPEIRKKQNLPWACANLMQRIAEADGSLHVDAIPPAVQPLAARGLVFVRPENHGGFELVLPTAYLIQMPTWDGEDTRRLRALLSQSSREVLLAVASHYMGRPATYPVSLGLEEAWQMIGCRESLEEQINALALPERRLLEAICQQGGAVLTEELLDLEREPLRLRNATGASPSRKGVGFSLERRAMLLPVRPNLHVVPTEVYEIVCAKDLKARALCRDHIRAFVLGAEYEPRRAKFALDPVPLAMAVALAVREANAEVRENAGTPRSLIARLANRFGRDTFSVALVCALSRVMGLWDFDTMHPSTPPGAMPLAQVGQALFNQWRQGGAWDEARQEPEVLRLPEDMRDESPVRIVREIVLDGLEDLGEQCWVPLSALHDYVNHDERSLGAVTALNRWAKRVHVVAPTIAELVETIVLRSLSTLGVVDIGDAETTNENDVGPLVRLTPKGRQLVSGQDATDEFIPSIFVDDMQIRVGTEATVAGVIGMGMLVEIGQVTNTLELNITQSAASKALSAGWDGQDLRLAVSSVLPLSPAVERLFDQISVVLARVELVGCAGFLWCDDVNIREMLRTRKQTADFFVDPSPPGGLLLAPSASLDVVVRRCRALGVEIVVDGEVLKTGPLSQPLLPEPNSAPTTSRSVKKSDKSKRSALYRGGVKGS